MIVLVLSDIHGNLPALNAVLDDAGTYDQVWNLGDTVGYGASPNECVDVVRKLPDLTSLSGNHDLAAIGQLSTSDFNHVAAEANHWTAANLRADNREWIAALPSSASTGVALLAHGSPRSPVTEYVISEQQVEENFAYFVERVCFVGHSHVPFVAGRRSITEVINLTHAQPNTSYHADEGKWIINPGSVGQPRDGDARASYGLLDPASMMYFSRRVPYNIQAAQRLILDAQLPKMLAERLAVGR